MRKLIYIGAILLSFLAQPVLAGVDTEKTPETAGKTQACSISGKIVDTATGEALAGVKVSLAGTNLVTYTNLDGNFSYAGLTPGNYNIETTYISYESTTFRDVVLQPEKENTLKMTLNPVKE